MSIANYKVLVGIAAYDSIAPQTCVSLLSFGHKIDSPTGTCLLVKRELAYFNPEFTGCYFEDLDLINTITKKGYCVMMEGEFPIFHTGRSTSDTLLNIKELTLKNEQIYRKRNGETFTP